MKPNNQPLYVHKESNHPDVILKNIPLGVNKRLAEISANQEVFNNAVRPYQEALNNSGHNHKLNFEVAENANQDSDRNKKKRNRR